jgi:hypothetical protein
MLGIHCLGPVRNWRWFVVDVEWTANAPDTESGPAQAERRTTAEDYVSQLRVLASVGAGYSEVSFADQPYPHLALSFRGPYGAVHKFSDEDEVALLVGNGVVNADEIVSLPGLEGDTEFTGDFVSSADRAIELVVAFVRRGSVDDLGEWEIL